MKSNELSKGVQSGCPITNEGKIRSQKEKCGMLESDLENAIGKISSLETALKQKEAEAVSMKEKIASLESALKQKEAECQELRGAVRLECGIDELDKDNAALRKRTGSDSRYILKLEAESAAMREFLGVIKTEHLFASMPPPTYCIGCRAGEALSSTAGTALLKRLEAAERVCEIVSRPPSTEMIENWNAKELLALALSAWRESKESPNA